MSNDLGSVDVEQCPPVASVLKYRVEKVLEWVYMGPKRTVEFKGKKVQAQSLDFVAKSEQWQQYELEDGSHVKMKLILLDVVRLDEVDEKGNPVYQFSAQQMIGLTVADELKKQTP